LISYAVIGVIVTILAVKFGADTEEGLIAVWLFWPLVAFLFFTIVVPSFIFEKIYDSINVRRCHREGCFHKKDFVGLDAEEMEILNKLGTPEGVYGLRDL
jgi:hypothetical protein